MEISKQSLELVGVTKQEFLDWCKATKKPDNTKKSRTEFFRKIKEGQIYRSSDTGEIVIKYLRGEKDE